MPDKSFQREIQLTDSRSLSVQNYNGPIELTSCPGNTLLIEAKISSLSPKTLAVTEVAAEVELTIKAPPWVPLSAKDINGDITGFDKLNGLKSMNGGLKIEGGSDGPILKTMNGPLTVETTISPGGSYHLKSMQGKIGLLAPQTHS